MGSTTDCCCGAEPPGRSESDRATSGGQPAAVGGPDASHPVLVVDADPALRGLLEEWMGELGCKLTYASLPGAAPAQGRYELVIVDVPFPRQGGLDLLRRVGNEHPHTPILALSSTFFGSIACAGAVARALGVASVLPKPVSCDALLSVTRNLLSHR